MVIETAKPTNRPSCKIFHGESIYSVFKTYSIFFRPRFTGMRDGAGAGVGSGGGGAGFSLAMIDSRW